MKQQKMPELPNGRLSILCLDDSSIDLLEDSNEGKQILSKTYEGLYILNINKHRNLSEFGLHIVDDTYLAKGTILVLSPYNSQSYAELGNARDMFSIQKAGYFFEFCQKLGASFVEMSDIRVRISEQKDTVDGKGGASVFEGNTHFEKAKKDELSSRLTRTLKLGESKPQLPAAEKLLTENNLMTDSVFRELYRMRECELKENGSPIKEYGHKITLVKTHEQSLDFALNLKLPSYTVGSSFSRARKEIYECESTIKVIF